MSRLTALFKMKNRLPFHKADIDEVLAHLTPTSSREAQIQMIENVLSWIRTPGSLPLSYSNYRTLPSARLAYLLQKLSLRHEAGQVFTHTVQSFLLETHALPLLAQTGLRQRRGLVSEIWDRALFGLLPRPSRGQNLDDIFALLFSYQGDAKWIRSLDPEVARQLLALIGSDNDSVRRLRTHFKDVILDAVVVLGTQVAAIGLHADVRGRSADHELSHSPFIVLQKALLKAHANKVIDLASCRHAMDRCRQSVSDVYAHLEDHGVSVDLVYQLDQIEQLLQRIESLLALLFRSPEDAQMLMNFIADLIESHYANSQLRDLVRNSIHLISRKVVERTGASGEHYITRTRREYIEMLLSSAGGGLITVATTFFKFVITHAHSALFFEGFFASLNYTFSFLTMQAFHFTLASKQPSMTAPALAGRLADLKAREQLTDFVQDVTCIARSQFAAAVGNLGVVIPGAFLWDALYNFLFHRHVLTPEYAQSTIESLHLLRSFTIPFAALTGVILWAGSISAGWVENWTIYHRLPEAIAQSRPLRIFLGVEGALRLAKWFTRNISGIAGNVFFGFYLGFTPIFGKFFGLPLDVRHITLSSGALSFAISSLGVGQIDTSQLVFAILGIIAILILNFGVSFALALYVAMRARRIRTVWLYHLGIGLLAHFCVRPLDFFLPIETDLSSREPDV